MLETLPRTTHHLMDSFAISATEGFVKATSLDSLIFVKSTDAAPQWQRLSAEARSLPYHSLEWCQAYETTLLPASKGGIVLAAGISDGRTVVLLPLALKKRLGVKTLTFLGDDMSNQNTGGWDLDYYKSVPQQTITAWLAEIGHLCDADCLILRNVPETWHGRETPLLVPETQSSPSPIFTLETTAEFDAVFSATHNKKARKNIARKHRNLEATGSLKIRRCTGFEEKDQAFRAFLEQRAVRAQLTGIPNAFHSSETQAFLQTLLGLNAEADGDTPLMDIWTLETDQKIRATYLCIEDGNVLYAYANSVAHDETLPNSPGLVLFKEIVSHACASPSIEKIDMGLGEERYKTAWAKPEPLTDCHLAITWKGHLFLTMAGAGTRLKTAIRNSKWAWSCVRKLRGWLASAKAA